MRQLWRCLLILLEMLMRLSLQILVQLLLWWLLLLLHMWLSHMRLLLMLLQMVRMWR